MFLTLLSYFRRSRARTASPRREGHVTAAPADPPPPAEARGCPEAARLTNRLFEQDIRARLGWDG